MAWTIMVQGTASGVGKSLLTTALCRLFTQDGYRVAPFKAQNLSNNVHTLADGTRMARSQALAAYACHREPHCDMNPLLLTPHPKGSEVILLGQSLGTTDRLAFETIREAVFSDILAAYHRLCLDADIVVVEGAGSPVELNLKAQDLVNMRFASAVGAPVILVSDIHRGGVFASLYGTVMLMEDAERRLLKGMVINQFMGETALFSDGAAILEERCELPILGILPKIDHKLEDEDALFQGEAKTRELLSGACYQGDTATYLDLLQQEFDHIAAAFRPRLTLPALYQIMKEGVL